MSKNQKKRNLEYQRACNALTKAELSRNAAAFGSARKWLKRCLRRMGVGDWHLPVTVYAMAE